VEKALDFEPESGSRIDEEVLDLKTLVDARWSIHFGSRPYRLRVRGRHIGHDERKHHGRRGKFRREAKAPVNRSPAIDTTSSLVEGERKAECSPKNSFDGLECGRRKENETLDLFGHGGVWMARR
jgi:hypothetical protein